MQKKDFFYELPEELIAQVPLEPRDSSRLMVYDRGSGAVEHRVFSDILEYLNPGDALVVNKTRVIPARLLGMKESSTVKVEFLLLKRRSRDEFEVIMRPGKRLKIGTRVIFAKDLSAIVLDKLKDGVALVRFDCEGVFENLLEKYGKTPLPPYIHQEAKKERYQTVYAEVNGSAAAPTAGFHFTEELLYKIREKGVDVVPVLLHVGLGTFRPVKEENIQEHVMHSEYYSVSEDSADRINAARKAGKRVVAVGTTSVRTLESAAGEDGLVRAETGDTNIFIYPGYRFKCVDALITNFHLPESTLIMLVSAFMGREETLGLYRLAVQEKYRFFSFGDAMFIH